ncbi:MAG: hypothetical protein KDC53_23040, partial [Saprospiraceae bacterium]|nr:hypothetical protein [Saprospiraceae bacterium]
MKRKKPTKTGRTPKTEMDSGVAESKASALKLDSDLLIVIALFITSLIAFWSLSIEGRIYTQGDNINDAIFYQQVDQYHDQTGEIARWNPYIFGGVPNIFNLPKSPLTLDYYLDLFSSLLSLPFVFFWMGAVGLYLLLRYLKFSRLQSLFGSLIFLLSPFYKSLVINGHGTKIEAIMYAPWIFWALFRLMDKKRWLDVLFLALFAGLQIRTSHYQVVFYTAILSVIFVVSHTVQEIRKREKYRYRMIFMIGVAAVGAVFLSARPLYLAAKYAGESIRGRDVIRLSEQNSTDVDHGVDKRFVETWSFTPGELMTLLVPRAMGGTSSEYYGRARSIGFRQDVIPGYWGHSPYNGSYYYLGAFIFFLLLIPVLWIKENPLLWQFIAGLILMMIWSLGTFAGPIYDLSYSIVPFFSNFRTPTTSLAMVYLMATILAVYGLSFLPRFRTGDMKKFWTIIGIGAGVTALFFLAGSGLSFANVRQNYQQNVLELLTEARRSMF